MRQLAGATCGAILALAVPVSAFGDGSFSGVVSIASDYRFRGISQSNRQVVPQLELDYALTDGWTFGTFVSGANFDDHEHTSTEIDLFVEKDTQLGDTALVLDAYYYSYPDHLPPPGGARYSTFEAIGKLSHDLGPVLGSVSLAWSPNFSGNTGTEIDATAGASWEATEFLSLSGSIGRQWLAARNYDPLSGYPYTHWDMGATASYKNASLDLRLVGTTLSHAQCLFTQGHAHWCETGAVVTLSFAVGSAEE